MPANVAAPRTGTVLVVIDLPAIWMNPASPPHSPDGMVTKTGLWRAPATDAFGAAAYFSIFSSADGTAHLQGTAGMAGSDLVFGNDPHFDAGEPFIVGPFEITSGAHLPVGLVLPPI